VTHRAVSRVHIQVIFPVEKKNETILNIGIYNRTNLRRIVQVGIISGFPKVSRCATHLFINVPGCSLWT
jgi:hypothetical protein